MFCLKILIGEVILIGDMLYNTIEDKSNGVVTSVFIENDFVYLAVFCVSNSSLSFVVRRDIVCNSNVWKIVKGNKGEKN